MSKQSRTALYSTLALLLLSTHAHAQARVEVPEYGQTFELE